MPNPSTLPTARQCAVQLLAEVLDRKRTFDEALGHHNGFTRLEERDRNFVRLMVMTALRRLGQIDAVLAMMLESPLKGRTQEVQHCLRLGVVQLLFLRTPAHAAVSETVDAVAALGHERMKGLANAVLKRVAKEGDELLAAQDAASLNTPAWLKKGWEARFGAEAARAIALARLDEAPLDITAKEQPEAWAQKLGGALLPTGSIRLAKAGRVEALEGYAEGEWWVQDAAAALPVKMLGDVQGKRVLDLCAAPGGKTLQLAVAGAQVVAVDQSARRLARLQENLTRVRLHTQIIEADLLKWKCEELADAILIDAPCSATGTLRRHPELVWHRTQEDMNRLVEIQQRLLRRAAKWLKPGGVMVYCVCSLQTEEGEAQVKAFLSQHADFSLEPATMLPPELLDAQGCLSTHPALQGGMDGFWAARLIKAAA